MKKKFLPLALLPLLLAACMPAGPGTQELPGVVPSSSSSVSSASSSEAPSALMGLPASSSSAPSPDGGISFRQSVARLAAQDGRTLSLQVELATTPAEQERGLMGRTALAEGSGMLFTFDAAQNLNFWMKNTLIPLDIVYFDADGAYVSSTTMVPCHADPCRLYPSQQPAMFALELPEGYVAREGIGPGWVLVQEGL